MKSIQCQHCEECFAGEAREEVLNKMLVHYKEAHPEVLASVDEAGKKAWMEEFERRWQAAPEL